MKRIQSIVMLVAILSGCYKYVPETAESPMLGVEYRAHLTPSGASSLAPVLGQSVIAVDGRFVELQQNTWRVAVSATHRAEDPRPTIWQGESISVPRDLVARLERRELDRNRTIRATALAVGAGLATGALIAAIGGKVSGSDPGGGGVIMPARVIP